MSTPTIALPTAGPEAKPALRFFRLLYSGAAAGQLCVFTLPDRRARWRAVKNLEGAAQAAIESDTNVYFGIGLQREAPKSGRGKEAGVIAIPGFWLDLDIQDPDAHVQSNLPADENEALQFVKGLPHQPTLIVHSGQGLHLYWLFDELWELEDGRARDEAKGASKAWQTMLVRKAAELGWKLDDTADLARVFRVPGTYNHKMEPPVLVTLLSDDGPRYARQSLIEATGAAGLTPESTTPLTAAELAKLAAPGTKEDRLRYTAHVLRAIPNDERFDRGKWIGIAHAVRAACGGGNENEARKLFIEWSETWTGGESKPGEAEHKWDTLGESKNTGGYGQLVHEAGSAYELPDDHPWRAENEFAAYVTPVPEDGVETTMRKVRAAAGTDPAVPEFVERLEEVVHLIQNLPSAKQQMLARALLLRELDGPLGRSAAEVIAAFERSCDDSDEPPFATLEDLLERPELLEPPDATIARLAYRGRLVLLAGPDKSGKSTLMAHAAAALSRSSEFLGEATRNVHGGRVVWVGLEESLGDAVRRFTELDAATQNLVLITYPGAGVMQAVGEQLTGHPADLVVIDSLTELARLQLGEGPKSGDDAGWATVMRPIVAIARKFDIAVVILHHVRKSDGQYRGSTEIAAAADALLELSMPRTGEDPNLRHVSARGRAGMWTEPFDVVLGEGGYGISGGGELPLEARILSQVRKQPGISLSALRDAVGVRHGPVKDAVWKLINACELDNLGDRNGLKLFIRPTAQDDFSGILDSASEDPNLDESDEEANS